MPKIAYFMSVSWPEKPSQADEKLLRLKSTYIKVYVKNVNCNTFEPNIKIK